MLLKEIFRIVFFYKKIILVGLSNTLLIWFGSILISVILAFIWAVLRDIRFFNKYIVLFFDCFSYIVQGIPFYIQVLLMTFYIGPKIGMNNTFLVGIVSLGLCSSAYGSQIIKVAYEAVPKDQFNLAVNLGYNKKDILFGVLIPQAIPRIIPLYISECDQLLKSTTILSTVGIFEFTKSCINIVNINFNMIPVYTILVLVYLTISLILRYIAYQYQKVFIKNKENFR